MGNDHIVRKGDTGETGNKGQFGTLHQDSADVNAFPGEQQPSIEILQDDPPHQGRYVRVSNVAGKTVRTTVHINPPAVKTESFDGNQWHTLSTHFQGIEKHLPRPLAPTGGDEHLVNAAIYEVADMAEVRAATVLTGTKFEDPELKSHVVGCNQSRCMPMCPIAPRGDANREPDGRDTIAEFSSRRSDDHAEYWEANRGALTLDEWVDEDGYHQNPYDEPDAVQTKSAFARQWGDSEIDVSGFIYGGDCDVTISHANGMTFDRARRSAANLKCSPADLAIKYAIANDRTIDFGKFTAADLVDCEASLCDVIPGSADLPPGWKFPKITSDNSGDYYLTGLSIVADGYHVPPDGELPAHTLSAINDLYGVEEATTSDGQLEIAVIGEFDGANESEDLERVARRARQTPEYALDQALRNDPDGTWARIRAWRAPDLKFDDD